MDVDILINKNVLPMPAVSASVSCMDLGNLADSIKKVEDSDVAFFHYDVVDGRFNKCYILGDILCDYLKKNSRLPIEVHLAVYDIEKSPCYICARMRRGYLYSKAKELGCNKIALGHHYDDVIETIFMGMMYGSQIQTMMPKLHSTNFEGMELIRPLISSIGEIITSFILFNVLVVLQILAQLVIEMEVVSQREWKLKILLQS